MEHCIENRLLIYPLIYETETEAEGDISTDKTY